MKTTKRQPRIRYHISEGIAAALDNLRREKHFNSWDEFFRAILIQNQGDASSKLPIPDPTPLRTVLLKFDSLDQTNAKILATLEALHEVNQLLHTSIEQTNDMVCGIRTLMEFALKPEQKELPSPDANDQTSKAQRYLRKRY